MSRAHVVLVANSNIVMVKLRHKEVNDESFRSRENENHKRPHHYHPRQPPSEGQY
jgi:hypothetical protein